MSDHTFTRRSTLAKFGGLVAAAAGGRALLTDDAAGGNLAVESGAVAVRPHPRADRGAVLHRRREAPARHPRRPSRNAAHACACACSTRRRASRSRAPPSTSGTPTPPGTTPGFGNAAASRTFLRGIQKTDANGLAVFTTIYPGWYQGRTVHIHVKVHVGGSVVHTGQLFFPDALTRHRLQGVAVRRPRHRGRLATRRLDLRQRRQAQLLALKKSGAGYVGSISMGVHK